MATNTRRRRSRGLAATAEARTHDEVCWICLEKQRPDTAPDSQQAFDCPQCTARCHVACIIAADTLSPELVYNCGPAVCPYYHPMGGDMTRLKLTRTTHWHWRNVALACLLSLLPLGIYAAAEWIADVRVYMFTVMVAGLYGWGMGDAYWAQLLAGFALFRTLRIIDGIFNVVSGRAIQTGAMVLGMYTDRTARPHQFLSTLALAILAYACDLWDIPTFRVVCTGAELLVLVSAEFQILEWLQGNAKHTITHLNTVTCPS